ncbi:MAG: hypothetical protein II779_08685 [Clostridia bacterium]|nr:hypothetical protein [Clostridia bacterium]
MDEKWLNEEISGLVNEEEDEEDAEYEEEEEQGSFLQEMINVCLELIARQIEMETGDAKAAQIVRDSKLPMREIHYLKE